MTAPATVNLSFRVDPPKVRLSIPPSGSQAGVFKVYNQSADPIKIRVYVEDWRYTANQDGTKDFFLARSTPLSCAEWLTFNPAEFVISGYGVQVVNYVARVPPDASGGRYAVMFFEAPMSIIPQEEDYLPEELKAGATINVRMGALFYIEAKGKVNRLAQLSNLSVFRDAKNKYYFITCDFKNIGNVDITAGGSFSVINKQGMVFARGEFDDIYTFPADAAKLSAVWKKPLPAGAYDLILTLNLGKALEEAGLGRGPVATREAEITIGANSEVLKVGPLK